MVFEDSLISTFSVEHQPDITDHVDSSITHIHDSSFLDVGTVPIMRRSTQHHTNFYFWEVDENKSVPELMSDANKYAGEALACSIIGFVIVCFASAAEFWSGKTIMRETKLQNQINEDDRMG